MSFTVRDVNEGVGVLMEGHGTITLNDFLGPMTEHLEQPKEKFRRYRYNLSDYTNVKSVDLPSTAIHSFANRCKYSAVVNPHPVIAIAANSSIAYGLSRMWQSLMGDQWEIRVFKSRADAEKWLSERVKEKFGIDDLLLDAS